MHARRLRYEVACDICDGHMVDGLALTCNCLGFFESSRRFLAVCGGCAERGWASLCPYCVQRTLSSVSLAEGTAALKETLVSHPRASPGFRSERPGPGSPHGARSFGESLSSESTGNSQVAAVTTTRELPGTNSSRFSGSSRSPGNIVQARPAYDTYKVKTTCASDTTRVKTKGATRSVAWVTGGKWPKDSTLRPSGESSCSSGAMQTEPRDTTQRVARAARGKGLRNQTLKKVVDTVQKFAAAATGAPPMRDLNDGDDRQDMTAAASDAPPAAATGASPAPPNWQVLLGDDRTLRRQPCGGGGGKC